MLVVSVRVCKKDDVCVSAKIKKDVCVVKTDTKHDVRKGRVLVLLNLLPVASLQCQNSTLRALVDDK